ncbi:MAG TPA: EamA family transporter [Thermoplasmata archaeon]|nr:EamA family transporter [Thermoplasmata archaeon]
MALPGRLDRGWTLHASLILLILFWGLAFVAIKQALVSMSWITLTLLRFAIADVLFVGYLVATRQVRHPPAGKDLPMLVILAFFGFTGYHLFLNLGETDPNVSAGTAALIIASAPAFIAIFAIPLLKERIGRWQSAGIALAFAGLAVMIFFVRPESQFTFRASEGALTVLPPAIFSALYAVLGKSYLRRYPPFTFVAWTLLIGTVLLVPLLIVTGRSVLTDLQTMGLAGWIPVLYLGLFPTFIGYGIWFRALERIPAASAGAYIYASTLVAVFGGIVILGESLTVGAIAGGAMVIAGVVLAQQLRKRSA